jgi:hypothetical protein
MFDLAALIRLFCHQPLGVLPPVYQEPVLRITW